MSRVYICHTFYHVYITLLRELKLGREHFGEATLILSTMSNNFTGMKERAEASGIFKDVYWYDEKEDVKSERVMSYHKDKGNLIANLLQRIVYTRLLGKLQEAYIPVDLKAYDDVYVFCDSDPIGYYLNYKKIKYHALEDGLNTCRLDDQARNSNLGSFELKCKIAKTGLIFIENGYSRYCIDFIVNDLKFNPNPPSNIVECPVDSLYAGLTEADHRMIVDIFLESPDRIVATLDAANYPKPLVMILTEPLCELDVREKLFRDIVAEYKDDYSVIIKPHPRDLLDYESQFSDCVVIRDRFPMEVMNDMPGLKVAKLVSVITQVEGIRFADEIVYLGLDFMDKYEAPEVHRKHGCNA